MFRFYALMLRLAVKLVTFGAVRRKPHITLRDETLLKHTAKVLTDMAARIDAKYEP